MKEEDNLFCQIFIGYSCGFTGDWLAFCRDCPADLAQTMERKLI
ncbi:hypothetical protein [Pseudobacillus badius]|nr:hypothetical protein [Bacillus badius]